jgi:ABC-type antimicrobial peptide transport system permease subunit
MTGSKADLVLSQPDTYDVSFSSVDESIGQNLAVMPEVKETVGMIEGFTQMAGEPVFIVFGYPQNSFILSRFRITEGVSIYSPLTAKVHAKPLMLGSAAAEVLDKKVGDTVRLQGSNFKVVGIYQTGDAFEDSGSILRLKDAQDLLAKPHQVSLFYIQLKDPALKDRLAERISRQWKFLKVSGTSEYASNQTMQMILSWFVWIIGGLAILIGGVTMMNAQLMSVFERTREIGVLRALGWSKRRVLWMILGESVVVCVLGGVIGVAIGMLGLFGLSKITTFFGASLNNIRPGLLGQAFTTVMVLGLVGGIYPAWKASRLMPVEALRYEGGSSSKLHRLPFGGMEIQSLWQRSSRTGLTIMVIGLTVGSIMALDGIIRGFKMTFNEMFLGSDAQIMLRQAEVADTSLSAIDERVGAKIALLPGVDQVAGSVISAVVSPGTNNFFIIQGYKPGEFLINRFHIVEGSSLTGNRQIILGRLLADSMKKQVGDTIELSGSRFRVVGIYESNAGWEQMGGVITLRDGQVMLGKPHKVTMYSVRMKDRYRSAEVVDWINSEFPDVHASLSSDFINEMPDMQNSDATLNSISLLAVVIGGLGVLNTMLMAVMERTREIGVLRALGWRKKNILRMILKESGLLGILGGTAGILIAFFLSFLISLNKEYGAMFAPIWSWDVFVRALVVAISLGIMGGIYPAFRASNLLPTEALRYE